MGDLHVTSGAGGDLVSPAATDRRGTGVRVKTKPVNRVGVSGGRAADGAPQLMHPRPPSAAASPAELHEVHLRHIAIILLHPDLHVNCVPHLNVEAHLQPGTHLGTNCSIVDHTRPCGTATSVEVELLHKRNKSGTHGMQGRNVAQK